MGIYYGLKKGSVTPITRENTATRIDQLSKAIKSLDVEKDRVIFIGDEILDAIAAAINCTKSSIVMRGTNTIRVSSIDNIEEDRSLWNTDYTIKYMLLTGTFYTNI